VDSGVPFVSWGWVDALFSGFHSGCSDVPGEWPAHHTPYLGVGANSYLNSVKYCWSEKARAVCEFQLVLRTNLIKGASCMLYSAQNTAF